MIKNSEWGSYFANTAIKTILKDLGLGREEYDLNHDDEIDDFLRKVAHKPFCRNIGREIKTTIIYRVLAFLDFVVLFFSIILALKTSSNLYTFIFAIAMACFPVSFISAFSEDSLEETTKELKKDIVDIIELRVMLSEYLQSLDSVISQTKDEMFKEKLLLIYEILDNLYYIEEVFEDKHDLEESFFAQLIQMLKDGHTKNIDSFVSFILNNIVNEIISSGIIDCEIFFEDSHPELIDKFYEINKNSAKFVSSVLVEDYNTIIKKVNFIQRIQKAWFENDTINDYSKEFTDLFLS